jgi:hypothetical protein
VAPAEYEEELEELFLKEKVMTQEVSSSRLKRQAKNSEKNSHKLNRFPDRNLSEKIKITNTLKE